MTLFCRHNLYLTSSDVFPARFAVEYREHRYCPTMAETSGDGGVTSPKYVNASKLA